MFPPEPSRSSSETKCCQPSWSAGTASFRPMPWRDSSKTTESHHDTRNRNPHQRTIMARRLKGEGCLIQTADGRWKGYVTIDGHRVWRTAKTKREAAEKLRRVPEELRQNHLRREAPTLGDFARELLEGPLKHDLRYATWALYETFWRLKLMPHSISDTRVHELRPIDCQRFIDDYHSAYKPSSLRRLGSFLSMVLQRAVELELRTDNPAHRVRYPSIPTVTKQVVAAEEISDLLARAPSARLSDMVLFAILTGLRRGEICGLRWTDIDLANRRIDVSRQMVHGPGTVLEGVPKTASSRRMVPLTTQAVELLERQPRSSQYVFCTSSGTAVRPDHLTRDFAKMRRGTAWASVRFHDLRATFISLMLQASVDVRTVQEVVGHSSADMTLQIYARSNVAQKLAAADRLSEATVRHTHSTEITGD